jgi:hypothetical protein
MPNRIIFLDIDGPMIPFSMFLIDRNCSFGRNIAPIPAAILKELCLRSGAKVVFNTTHNLNRQGDTDIVDAVCNAGLPRDAVHPDRKTRYPDLPRAQAVIEWLHRHPETDDWIAFDDAKFTEADNLIWIDPDAGLHLAHMNQALDRWQCSKFMVL